jgi:hypothetical protein
VFPVAGRGTRFLPATKASPKEMLPIVDKPLIQYAAEEALAAGARNLVFITGCQTAIEITSIRTPARAPTGRVSKHDPPSLSATSSRPKRPASSSGRACRSASVTPCSVRTPSATSRSSHLADDLIYGEVGCLCRCAFRSTGERARASRRCRAIKPAASQHRRRAERAERRSVTKIVEKPNLRTRVELGGCRPLHRLRRSSQAEHAQRGMAAEFS